ncbi:MAG TPA: CHAD domain-containing protein [Thermoleophilaceae bacterium]|jgi:CHAD domain-containing protein|nr:CHAD domain-containing protein [Thermoleophilaceae bacterium]
MSLRTYGLEQGEPLIEGLRRIAVGRIDNAIEALSGELGLTPEQAVHEARKDLKKLRSLLRLVRGGLGEKTYRRELTCFRDAAAELAGARDSDVMVATLDGLGLAPELAGPLRRSLEANRLRSGGPAHGAVIEMLRSARERVGAWSVSDDSFHAVRPGLERMYRGGRRGFRSAREQPSVEELHEWRKRVKDLWYQQTLLRSLWPPVMKAVADEAHELSDLLGDDHDLAMLLDWAREHAEAPPELVEAVERRRHALQAAALALGARLYSDKPSAFVRRLERCWRAAAHRRTRLGQSPATSP